MPEFAGMGSSFPKGAGDRSVVVDRLFFIFFLTAGWAIWYK
jgi:hypothetical protein